MLSFSLQAQNELSQARIYINPGHGGWGSNDRPLATINHPALDSLSFFESSTVLVKGLELRDDLTRAGAGYVRMSRTVNGIYTPDPPSWPNSSPNSKYPEIPEGTVVDGVTQIITLSVICEDVEANNMDYFVSIHSNATDDGSTTNYPLILYRGTDTDLGNGLTNARNMANAAWPYIVKNDITYHSAYTASSNVRGDISFYGSSATTSAGGTNYTGYLGVLRHGCDGYLCEECFHTYQPERQRLLNKDYCKMEGLRFSRAIRAWFGDNTETKGCIEGTVKDKSRSLINPLYNFKIGTNDEYYPLNNATVILKNSGGQEIGRYTTDNEYNGVFVFTDLTPGNYQLVFDADGFDEETSNITVVANETAFIVQAFGAEPVIDTACLDFKDPTQDGDIAAASSYRFEQVDNLKTVDALANLTVRRAILRDGKYYVLAVDDQKSPKLLVIDPETGDLIKEMSTEGIVTEGYQGTAYPYVLSDIAFTADGVLIGTNSTVVGRENNQYQTGDFIVYKWAATETTALEDATPQILITLPTNTTNSIAAAGNNYSNMMANSIAVSGCSDNFTLFFDSHPGNDWTTDYNVRHVGWKVQNGVLTGTQYNDLNISVLTYGADVQMNLSPLGSDRYVVDGNTISPTEIQFSWTTNTPTFSPAFAGDVPVVSTGANYFRYAGKNYMTAPVCEKQSDNTYSYKSILYDITNGLDKAENIGETDAVITNEPVVSYMASAGVVDNADINIYLLVGNKLVKYRTVTEQGAAARVFAYNLTSSYNGSGYDISFDLNEDANSVDIILNDNDSGQEAAVIPLGSLSKGNQHTVVPNSDIPEGGEYFWSIRANADNVTRFTKISDDSEKYKYFTPKSAAIDKSPESDYFGRIYITNSADGTKDGRATTKGVYVLNPLFDDVTSQGNTAYSGNVTWSGAAGQDFRKATVAQDGRIFISDASATNSGVYIMNPSTFEMSQIFTGTRNATGQFYSGSTYIGGVTSGIGVRGEGDDTKLYIVDLSNPDGITWRRWINTYNLGAASTWTTIPSTAGYSSSYVGNENNSLALIDGGYWAGQYRGAGSNVTGTPCMFYYSEVRSAVTFNTGEFPDGAGGTIPMTLPSQNGGLAVNENESLIALSYNGGVQVFSYIMGSNGIPVVSMKFFNNLGVSGVTYDDFEFDYAGNLYAVSASGGLVSVWGMPTNDNTCITPAKRSMVLVNGGGVGINKPDVKTFHVIRTPSGIEVILNEQSLVELYSITGMLIDKTTANGTYSHNLANGVYIIRVNGKSVKFVR